MAGIIRLAAVGDSEQIAAIYSHFVLNTPVSFESAAPDATETAHRISTILEQYPWLVCDVDGKIAGYAYASQHRIRFHYQWSVDVAVYVHESFRRQGIATALYTTLLGVLPLQGYVSAFAGITLPNPGSVGLHEAMGFTSVGIYRNVGFKLGQWHDVGWWQRTITELPSVPHSLIRLADAVGCDEWVEAVHLGSRELQL